MIPALAGTERELNYHFGKHSGDASSLVPTSGLSLGEDFKEVYGDRRERGARYCLFFNNGVSYNLFGVLHDSAKEIISFLSNEFLSQ